VLLLRVKCIITCYCYSIAISSSTVVRRLNGEGSYNTIDILSDALVNIGSYIHGHTSFAGARSGDGEEKPFVY